MALVVCEFVLQIGGYEIDLPQFSRVVKQFGGLQKVTRLFYFFFFCTHFSIKQIYFQLIDSEEKRKFVPVFARGFECDCRLATGGSTDANKECVGQEASRKRGEGGGGGGDVVKIADRATAFEFL